MKTAINQLIQTALPQSQVFFEGEGCQLTATIISEAFHQKTPVKRQQIVYQALNDLITRGELHAITLKTLTPTEWKAQHG